MADIDLKGAQSNAAGHINILCWNVTSLNAMVDPRGGDSNMLLRSAVPRHTFIERYLATFDVVILQESKVEASPFTGPLKGWKWESIPCRSKKCVGMLFGHREGVSSKFSKGTIQSYSPKPKDGTPSTESESQWISGRLGFNGFHFRIVTLYRHKFTKFAQVEDKLAHFLQEDFPTLFIGDMNVRIGPLGAWPDKERNRNCRDKITEGPFKAFLKLLETNRLIILNGQTRGDEAGEFTNADKTTIDYAAVNEELRERVVAFKVDTEISGNKAHRPITVKLIVPPNTAIEDVSEEIEGKLKNIRIATGEKEAKKPVDSNVPKKNTGAVPKKPTKGSGDSKELRPPVKKTPQKE